MEIEDFIEQNTSPNGSHEIGRMARELSIEFKRRTGKSVSPKRIARELRRAFGTQLQRGYEVVLRSLSL